MRGLVLATGIVMLMLPGRTARADLTPLQTVDLSTPQKREASDLDSKAAQALVNENHAGALVFAEQAIRVDATDPWAHYDRAVALGGLGRIDEAVSEYRLAQARFGSHDEYGASVSIYGRAHLLAENRRCEEAEKAYEEYANLVQKDAPREAEMALSYASDCPLPGAQPPAVSSLSDARRLELYEQAIERFAVRLEKAPAMEKLPADEAKVEQVRIHAAQVEASARELEKQAQTKQKAR